MKQVTHLLHTGQSKTSASPFGADDASATASSGLRRRTVSAPANPFGSEGAGSKLPDGIEEATAGMITEQQEGSWWSRISWGQIVRPLFKQQCLHTCPLSNCLLQLAQAARSTRTQGANWVKGSCLDSVHLPIDCTPCKGTYYYTSLGHCFLRIWHLAPTSLHALSS